MNSYAYDIVNTVVYVSTDRPALSMFGKKLWFSRRELIKFGVDSCYISEKSANIFYDDCVKAVQLSIVDLQDYIVKNPAFSTIGQRMVNTWNLSLKNETHKEVPVEIRRNWAKN